MSRPILLLILVCALGLQVNGQKFFYFQSNGEVPLDYDLNTIIDSSHFKLITSSEANEKLSASQALPFPFKYSGFTYNNYKVSDNGYLSFNTSTNFTSYKPDSNFSNTNNLRNCLFPFWYDFRLKKLPFPNTEFPNKIYSYTIGEAPNRQHIIQFFGLTKSSDSLVGGVTNANVFAFAIIFHEGNAGRFDYVYNFFGKSNIKGLVGFLDNSGNGLIIKDKPINFPVASSSERSNIIVYQFLEGVQPKKALYVKQNLMAGQYLVNEPVTISSKISNIGTDTIYNFDYQYIVNTTDSLMQSIQLTGAQKPLLPNGENALLIGHATPWSGGLAGSINTIKVNALITGDTANNQSPYATHLSKVLRIKGLHPVPRNVLFEVSTGGWCGYCPSAHVVSDESSKLLKTRFIPVMHHFGDPMEDAESNKVNTAYQKGYPYGVIDRKFFSGQATGWQNIINQQISDSSVVDIQIVNRNFDAVSRMVSFTLKVKFHDYMLGNYRVGAMITENNVRGYVSPSQWSQNNYYSKFYSNGPAGGPNHPYYNELHYMDGYLHQHVVLNMPYGAWGKDSSFPNFIRPEDEYSFDFSYKLPATTIVDYNVDNNTKYCSTIDDAGKNEGMYKPNDLGIVGFVAAYSDNAYERSILNANANGLLYEYSNLKKIVSPTIHLFPNPANDQINIELPNDLNVNGQIKLYDQLGNCVKTIDSLENSKQNTIDISDMAIGLYWVKLVSNEIVYSQAFSIVR